MLWELVTVSTADLPTSLTRFTDFCEGIYTSK
jgi:hypothetical protein